ncbi:3',5'-cyclic-nucleotide phosphodiesterase regA [Choanephora cucurbitarum]|uniref:3',5'-cyclic-nucleotide phosphodiesterase regA n=1 Tax=Choanephora cucurbitarum TaxID=101091 RepID=A0A1C7NEC9_9FUNG|nr:3',5'-cyclic-nucleotide phosphodiesterase regA [Choanephora cucurbitarum]
MLNASFCTVVILHQIKPYPDYQQLLISTFGKEQTPLKAIERCRHNKNSLLLVDLDAIDFTLHENALHLLETVERDLKTSSIPLVVCSNDDSAQFMLDCLQAGAVDYLLKPIYSNVIKTLFLKLFKRKESTLLLPQQHHSIPSPTSLYERIKDTHLSKTVMEAFVPKTMIQVSPLTKKQQANLKTRIFSWDFGPFGLTTNELVHVVYLIFDQVISLPDLSHIVFSQSQWYDFIIDLASAYHDQNPYHNFAHAVDVLQCLFVLLCESGLLPFSNKTSRIHLLTAKDIFALLIAAIGHDAAHPGVNNAFLINSSNPLATLYNDRSVLESLHSMTLFQLLNKHGLIDLIGGLHSEDYKAFRKTVVSSILATDMSLHLEYVAKIKEQAIRFHQNQVEPNDLERNLLCSALIKCADISNVARPFRWGTQWAELLIEEFVCQGDLEKELGMPVLPMNDRDKVILEDSQIGFIRFVALDLFQNVREILVDLSFAVDQIQANLKQWETRKHALTAHDSGVSNLLDEEDTFDSDEYKYMIETGSKRSSSMDLCSSGVKKRAPLEKQASIYHPIQLDENNVSPGETRKNPVYCQCAIQ